MIKTFLKSPAKINLSLKVGRKFIKVVNDNSVWGFVAKVDGVHKGVPMLKGDILKAAGWRAPAKHSRGSIFDKEMHNHLFLNLLQNFLQSL